MTMKHDLFQSTVAAKSSLSSTVGIDNPRGFSTRTVFVASESSKRDTARAQYCGRADLARPATFRHQITDSVAVSITLEPEAKRWNFISATIFCNLVKLDAIKIIDN
jgi:hypothetical protein